MYIYSRILRSSQNTLTKSSTMCGSRDSWNNMFSYGCNTCRFLQNNLARLFGVTSSRKFTVAVEGNIASGKTTFLQLLDNNKYAQVYTEPVHKWRNIQGHNALAYMYEDPKRWALTLQTYVQLTMLETHLQKQTKPGKLMERSIYSAKYCFVENLYKSGAMPEIEYFILTRWFDWIISNMDCNLDLIVYLRTDPKVVQERIRKRGRREEKPVPLEYLEALHNLHEDWLIHRTQFELPCEVLVLDGNQDMDGVAAQIEEHKKRILFGYDTKSYIQTPLTISSQCIDSTPDDEVKRTKVL